MRKTTKETLRMLLELTSNICLVILLYLILNHFITGAPL